MRKCPKCSATYDEILNFCKACGAMLDTIEEKPLRTADGSFHNDENSQIISSPVISGDSLMRKGAGLPQTAKADPAASFGEPRRQCPKCGSSKVIPDIRAVVHTSDGVPNVSAYIDADPDALIFKDRLYAEFFADICGDCGHVGLKVLNPHNLYNHYLQSKKNQ